MINRGSPEGFPDLPPSDGPAPEGAAAKKKKGSRSKKNTGVSEEAKSEQQSRDPGKAQALGKLFTRREPESLTDQPRKKERAKRSEPAIEAVPKDTSDDSETKTSPEELTRLAETDLSADRPEFANGVDEVEANRADRLDASKRKPTEQTGEIHWRAELRGNQLHGGEVVIDLKRSIAEPQELPLNDEPEAPADEQRVSVDEVVQGEPPTGELEAQPEQMARLDSYEASGYEIPAVVSAPDHGDVSPPEPPERHVSTPTPPLGRPPVTPMVRVAERPEPAAVYRWHAERDAVHRADASSPGEAMVPQRQAEDAEYYAARAAQSRGLITGLFVAGLYEHFKHKRRERRAAKRFRAQTRQLQQSRGDQRFYAAEQAKKQAESERRLTSAEERFTNAERELIAREQRTGKRFEALERVVGRRQKTAERPGPEISEQLKVPSEHRLQTSAWHTIEVDKRTGRPVDRQTFAYGREYHRERAHETALTSRRNTVAGEVALIGAAGARAGGMGDASAPVAGTTSQIHTPGTTQGSPHAKRRSQGLNGSKLRTMSTAAGPIWPYILLLLVIFVCVVALVR